MASPATVSTAFPYQSKFIEVLGSKMHYIEEGSGDPILFLHGPLLSNYTWRNIIPALAPYGRCIAVDLIGSGKSDKPDIAYRLFDHIKYIEAFIDALKLSRITLVMHGAGSLIGFDYAVHHPAKIKALAFMEALLRPVIKAKDISLPGRELIRMLQTPDKGYQAIVDNNELINKILPMMIMRKLTEEELTVYRQPFLQASSRKVLWQFIQDLPFPHGPEDVRNLVNHYSNELQKLALPKLLLFSMPGFFTSMESVMWAREHLSNLKVVDLGEALHCPQETNPVRVQKALVNWCQEVQITA